MNKNRTLLLSSLSEPGLGRCNQCSGPGPSILEETHMTDFSLGMEMLVTPVRRQKVLKSILFWAHKLKDQFWNEDSDVCLTGVINSLKCSERAYQLGNVWSPVAAGTKRAHPQNIFTFDSFTLGLCSVWTKIRPEGAICEFHCYLHWLHSQVC